jgi:phosphosulfolactate synthase
MNSNHVTSAWDAVLVLPQTKRFSKPRTEGITMVIDKGLGITEMRDLLEMAASHIDFIKIAFGSSALYPTPLMKEKIALVRSHGVQVYPGGTLFEIAFYQGMVQEFFARARDLGFTYVEISEGTIDLPPKARAECIKQARDWGFGVVSEIGKKDKSVKIQPGRAIEQILTDLENGAEKVIIEGRDSGKGVGIYDDRGEVNDELLDEILAGIKSASKIIIEAPQVSQHNHLLLKLGPNVNLGNVQPHDVLTLESTRVGLRGDTLRECLKNAPRSYRT